MKRIKLYFCLILLVLFEINYVSGQQQHDCGQHILMDQMIQKSPEVANQYMNAVRKTIKSIDHNRGDAVYTIPVVFHILHQGGNENISDAQIHDQIRILNRDYQKQNADTSVIVPVFKPLIANVGFEFKLAQIDPDGNCTDGIIRHYTTKTVWDANNLNDFTYSWPRDKYMNIYVVKSINIAATAYTFLPGTPIQPAADAIVTLHNMVGSIGTSSIGTSRVLTHEVGHWFGLPHIWGVSNAPGVECGDDFVGDTPITKGFTTCSINNAKICNPNIIENVQNYMDYSPCKIMFTIGQSDYMHGTIASRINDRDYLVSIENLIATGLVDFETCSIKADYFNIENRICVGDSIRFTNQSKIKDSLEVLSWKLNNVPISNQLIDNESVTITFDQAGEFNVTLLIKSGNQTDSITKVIFVEDGANGQIVPFAYGFESGMPADIQIYNPNEDNRKWSHNDSLGANGTTSCISLLSFGGDRVSGNVDYFETQFFNLTEIDKPSFSYYYAYAKAHPDQNDSFRIEYTTDCGETWKKLPTIPTPATMAAKSGGTTKDPFAPQPSQWVKVDLTAAFRLLMKNKPSVKFRFYFRVDAESFNANNLYIDEININNEAISGTAEILKSSDLQLSPNPAAHTAVLTIETDLIASDLSLQLSDIAGQMLPISTRNISDEGKIGFEIRNLNDLNSGMYFIKINHKGRIIASQKMVVVH